MFQCDYTEGCHPQVMERLVATNLEQSEGYGEDEYCEAARASVRRFVEREDVDVHFLVGGTQTNATVIAAALRPHQGVLCAATGHINVHETGAIEAAGHKVLVLPSADGKLDAETVRGALAAHAEDACREHTVQPGMVYVSHPTETGALYTLAELRALSAVCRAAGVLLYADGAARVRAGRAGQRRARGGPRAPLRRVLRRRDQVRRALWRGRRPRGARAPPRLPLHRQAARRAPREGAPPRRPV